MTPYLLENPNPFGPHYYPKRRGKVLAIVMHVTAGLEGIAGRTDLSAEKTARYAATTDRKVSWHSGSDTDSHLQLVPDSFTAFHCVGYNSVTVGHEISKRDTCWADESPEWVAASLRQAAASLAPRAKELGIPLRKATKAELDRAIRTNGAPVGFVSHSDLDPKRRSDPGADFPWRRFLDLMAPTAPTEDEMTPAEWTRFEKLIDDRVRILLRAETEKGVPTGHPNLRDISLKLDALHALLTKETP